jgi:hypothetical protein
MANLTKLLTELSNDGEISLYYGPPPKGQQMLGIGNRWRCSVQKFGKVTVTMGSVLNETVVECHRLVYLDVPKPAA